MIVLGCQAVCELWQPGLMRPALWRHLPGGLEAGFVGVRNRDPSHLDFRGHGAEVRAHLGGGRRFLGGRR